MRKVFAMADKDPNRVLDEYNPISVALSKLPKEEQDRFREEFEVYDNYMMTHKRRDNNEELALQEVDRVFGYTE